MPPDLAAPADKNDHAEATATMTQMSQLVDQRIMDSDNANANPPRDNANPNLTETNDLPGIPPYSTPSPIVFLPPLDPKSKKKTARYHAEAGSRGGDIVTLALVDVATSIQPNEGDTALPGAYFQINGQCQRINRSSTGAESVGTIENQEACTILNDRCGPSGEPKPPVANLVAEEAHYPKAVLHTPLATSGPCCPGNVKWSAYSVATVLVVAVVLLTTLLVNQQDPSSSSVVSNQVEFKTDVGYPMNILPADTINFVQEDQYSPQAKAYHWWIGDPDFTTYSEKRLIQRFALATLYYAMHGDSWSNNTHWLNYSVPECEWFFSTETVAIEAEVGDMSSWVSMLSKGNDNSVVLQEGLLLRDYLRNPRLPCVSLVDDNVMDSDNTFRILLLHSNNLEGSIPQELYLLTSLELVLLMANENLQGSTISTQIGDLSSMMVLAVDSCGIVGEIPTELGNASTLELLSLSNNALQGTIPTELFQLNNLFFMTLEWNNLTGAVPSEVGLVSKNLLQVYLGHNHLTSIPSEVGLLSNLQHFWINSNSLSMLPSEVGLLSNLRLTSLPVEASRIPGFTNIFLIDDNPLVIDRLPSELVVSSWCEVFGFIPSEVGREQSSMMEELYCACYRDCNAIWTSPTQLALLTALTSLSMHRTKIYGPLPSELGWLTSLLSLNLSDNHFSGAIPSELGLLTGLLSLSLTGNNFSPSIPTELGGLSALGGNSLSGALPSELGLLTGLTSLNLGDNRLGSSLPSELGLLSFLSFLNLTVNRLTGPLPSEVCLLTDLRVLHLSDNSFSSTLPSEIGFLFSLSSLSLGGNHLTGALPSEFGLLTGLEYLVVNKNSFNSSLPSELGLMFSLRELYLDENDFSGAIPSELGLLPKMTFLNLSGNNFH